MPAALMLMLMLMLMLVLMQVLMMLMAWGMNDPPANPDCMRRRAAHPDPHPGTAGACIR
jgi:hypothetical protein